MLSAGNHARSMDLVSLNRALSVVSVVGRRYGGAVSVSHRLAKRGFLLP